MKTKITVLGCGNAFSLRNGNACFLIEAGKGKILIDAGRLLPEMLAKQSIDIKSITDVYVSHAHDDHVGGLPFLALSRYDWLLKPKIAQESAPSLICNSHLMERLWENTLKGGLSTLEGVDSTLETFFHLKPIQPNQSFFLHGLRCSLIQQVHIMSGSIIMDSFGLFVEAYKNLYFVTDSQYCSPHQLEKFYRDADIIFQDAELIGVDTKNKEMKFCSHVHANYGQLANWKGSNSTILPKEIKEKMWLTHYQDFLLDNKDFYGNECDWQNIAKEDGFKGFLTVGQKIDI